jgi:hypothetical protein
MVKVVELIVKLEVAVNVLPELTKIEVNATVFASKVTVNPPSITTSSPMAGAAAPAAPPEMLDHVAVELQLPDATE